MDFLSLYAEYTALTLFALASLAFTAGFIDAIVGGGGLIQLPALLINLPATPLPTLFGTNKIASLAGTLVSAYKYSMRVTYDFRLLGIIAVVSFIGSNLGARSLMYLDSDLLRPAILVILILIAIYTFIKKDLGAVQKPVLPFPRQVLYGSLIGLVVSFYDGFFGPGAGSFLILGFVVILGFEFVSASAYAKVINCVTNIGALAVFLRAGNYLLEIALIMALCNITGSYLGSRMAMMRGNGFVRVVFLGIVTIMILRYSYDIWYP
jgi:uncharacterized protein